MVKISCEELYPGSLVSFSDSSIYAYKGTTTFKISKAEPFLIIDASKINNLNVIKLLILYNSELYSLYPDLNRIISVHNM